MESGKSDGFAVTYELAGVAVAGVCALVGAEGAVVGARVALGEGLGSEGDDADEDLRGLHCCGMGGWKLDIEVLMRRYMYHYERDASSLYFPSLHFRLKISCLRG